VIAIRNSKLPPVEEIPSAGSFFKNPIVTKESAAGMLADFPEAPHWEMSDGQVKLAAGWLIDKAGLRGYAKYGFQLYPKNALVITNVETANSAENLAKFKAEIVEIVQKKFGITLEQEPESLSVGRKERSVHENSLS
jgi:UDP-N-acetylmuramate dehydrogenase